MMPELADQSKPQSLCVVRLSAIGDTCHALAVVRRLQDNWPQAHISWIIGKTEASLMAGVDGVELIIFDKAKGFAAYKELRTQLRDRHFDYALCMHASVRANLFYRDIKATLRLGFDKARARDFQWLFTDSRIAAASGEHALDAMMSFATTIGAEPRKLRWDIPLPQNARLFANQFVAPGQPLVVISPCSSQRSRNYRNWSIANYAAIIRHLQKRHSCRVVLTGGDSPVENEYAAALSADADSVSNLIGKTTLKELLALLARAELVICPDSGPAHMATTVGTAVIGLFASSNPERTGPYLHRELSVNRYPDAVRQFLDKDVRELRWGRRVRDPGAMALITIGDVTDKIDDFFGK